MAHAGLTNSTPQRRQAVLRDLLANDASLWPALRHLVEQPGFEAMLQERNTAIRQAQRDALLQELETWCNQTSLRRVEEFLNGALQRNSSTPERSAPADEGAVLSSLETDQPGREASAPERARSEPNEHSRLTAAEETERLIKQASDCDQLGEHMQAIQLCTRALELDPSRISALMQLAQSYSLLGESRAALQDLNTILKLEPNNSEALAERGKARAAIGLLYSAKQDWIRAERLGHSLAGGLFRDQREKEFQALREESRVYTNQGITKSGRGDYEDAVRLFSKALDRDSDNLNALTLRGQAYAAMGRMDEAKRDWVRASNRGQQQAKAWLSGLLEHERGGSSDSRKAASSAENTTNHKGRIKHQRAVKTEDPNGGNPERGALGGYAALGVLVLGITMAMSGLNTSSQPPVSTSDSSVQATEQISQQLSQAQELATNARLICEHQQVLNALSQINDSQANASQLDEKKQLSQKANAAIRELDAPGREKYWEVCIAGVGFQRYDDYEWIYGEDYKGTLFAVASKRCKTPAVRLNAYSTDKPEQKIYSQWISFNPDPQSGKASSIPFTIPASALPSQGSIKWGPTDVLCNA
ncbi:MAG: tetratricopeptide repeat protein [Cyanobium sp.]